MRLWERRDQVRLRGVRPGETEKKGGGKMRDNWEVETVREIHTEGSKGQRDGEKGARERERERERRETERKKGV